MRREIGLALLLPLSLMLASGCIRAKAEVTERDGVRVVSNSAEGDERDRPHERLHTLWKTTGTNVAGQPGFEAALWADSDRGGNIYVLDHATQRITKLDASGRVLGQLAGRGEKPGQLSKSERFTWSDGYLYVANGGNGRIEVLRDSGEALPPIQLSEVKAPGEIYVANGNFVVGKRFARDGSYAYVYTPDWKVRSGLRKTDPIAAPIDILRTHNTTCPSSDGLWILSMLENRIEKYGWDGRKLLETSRDLDWDFPKDARGRVLPELLVHRACTVDRAGNLYVVYSNPENWKRGNEVYKFAPDGRLLQKAFELPILNATMIRFDRDGNLLYSDGRTLTKASVERVP
ncbi:MAG TPA: hypothetical protein VHW00_16970 [Thermoanaerobaculia bacterium]|nr:hypothetical protein [Thermoanaerobaculia bacterium]